jgi:hypothetical protein
LLYGSVPRFDTQNEQEKVENFEKDNKGNGKKGGLSQA